MIGCLLKLWVPLIKCLLQIRTYLLKVEELRSYVDFMAKQVSLDATHVGYKPVQTRYVIFGCDRRFTWWS